LFVRDSRLVSVFDYGSGNVGSIGRMLDQLQCPWLLSSEGSVIANCTHLILPGVGHGGQAMKRLRSSPGFTTLLNSVCVRKTPVLGICLGMQIMTRYTEEGPSDCLNLLSGEAVELAPSDLRLKVPNIGWHTLKVIRPDPILSGIDTETAPFYFCHRYAIYSKGTSDTIAELDYGASFAAIIRKDNVIGVQFHPEKSHDSGLRLFENFLQMGSSNMKVD